MRAEGDEEVELRHAGQQRVADQAKQLRDWRAARAIRQDAKHPFAIQRRFRERIPHQPRHLIVRQQRDPYSPARAYALLHDRLTQRRGDTRGNQVSRISASSMSRPSVSRLYAAKGREAAIHGHDDAVDEARAGAAEPEERADEFVRLTEAACRGVGDDGLATRGQAAIGLGEQGAILLADEESRGRWH